MKAHWPLGQDFVKEMSFLLNVPTRKTLIHLLIDNQKMAAYMFAKAQRLDGISMECGQTIHTAEPADARMNYFILMSSVAVVTVSCRSGFTSQRIF